MYKFPRELFHFTICRLVPSKHNGTRYIATSGLDLIPNQNNPQSQPDTSEVVSPSFQQLTLSSTFNRETRTLPNVAYSKLSHDSGSSLNMYSCGPTVYADSHLGHAISYTRCDLTYRMLKTFCNLNVHFAMNITDIDDKIIAKSNEQEVDYRDLSNEFYQSFVNDMNSLRISPPDTYLKVSDNVDVIGDYIKRIHDKGFAYVSPETGDINFDYDKFIDSFAISNAMHSGINLQTTKSFGKKSPKDFTLWKVSKEGEPKWRLELDSNLAIDGRPGWHVECSALSNYIFGSKLDIHFGGFDLIFPHHHCESCCSHAYQYEPTPPPPAVAHPSSARHRALYSNANVWLHSGHLILRSEKMSKSLGNVVLIKDFVQKYSANLIRLLCIRTHYRSEIDFDEKLLHEMSTFDEKLREFVNLIDFYIYKLSSSQDVTNGAGNHWLDGANANPCDHDTDQMPINTHLSTLIDNVERQIYQGILDNLDLNLGLESIIDLANQFSKLNLTGYGQHDAESYSILLNCIRLRTLISRWLDSTGLDYGSSGTGGSANSFAMCEHLIDFRASSRLMALDALRILKKLDKSLAKTGQKELIAALRQQAQQTLGLCDQTRTFLDRQGIKLKDQPSAAAAESPKSS